MFLFFKLHFCAAQKDDAKDMSSGSEVLLKHGNRISHTSKNVAQTRFDARSNAHEVKTSVSSPDENVTVNQHGKNIILSVPNIAPCIFNYIYIDF